MIQSFLQTEVGEVIGAEFISEEGRELLVLFEESVFPVGAEDMMAVLDLFDDGGEFSAEPLGQTRAKDLADFIGGQPPES